MLFSGTTSFTMRIAANFNTLRLRLQNLFKSKQKSITQLKRKTGILLYLYNTLEYVVILRSKVTQIA